MAYRDLDRPPLAAAALRAALGGPGRFWTDVVVTAQTGSTNADVAAAARAGAPEGTVHTTDLQTAGRGRLDRSWQLPLLAGLAVDATVHQCGVESGLKWPNDVLVEDRKIAGILLERVESPHGAAAVIGVGLNVSLRRDELPVDTATSLALEGATETDRTIVLRSFLRNLEALYRAWSAAGGDPASGIRESYVRRCVTLGTQVRVSLPDGGSLDGRATGIDDLGRLLVDGTAISAGDITHVRAAT
jgi:BirA family biotin operon repressor/biotin-[acetyl-CoA-carboxylase] ligase